MSDLETRLVRCFASVFPDLASDEIPGANITTVPRWDSLAAVTLAAVVQEEFDVEIDLLDLGKLDSFRAFQEHLRSLTGATG